MIKNSVAIPEGKKSASSLGVKAVGNKINVSVKSLPKTNLISHFNERNLPALLHESDD